MGKQVVDIESDRLLGTGELGELWFKTPSRMKGYLNNIETTNHTIDRDGWIRSGVYIFHE